MHDLGQVSMERLVHDFRESVLETDVRVDEDGVAEDTVHERMQRASGEGRNCQRDQTSRHHSAIVLASTDLNALLICLTSPLSSDSCHACMRGQGPSLSR